MPQNLNKFKQNQIIIVHKPKGITSRQAVDLIRKKLKIKKAGHAGTLDPQAEGVLIVLTGKKTKEQTKFMGMEKEYLAEIEFGVATNTFDSEGKVIEKLKKSAVKDLSLSQIKEVLPQFIGKISQKVPYFSAIKVKGVRLYKLARKGYFPKQIPERRVEIKDIKILGFKNGTIKTYPLLKIKVTCGKGVYIRQLAVDIGKTLNLPCYLKNLIRSRIGKATINQALLLSRLV